MSRDLLETLADLVQHRYFGKYRGLVVGTTDTEMRGRLQVQVPAVLGSASLWAEPCVPYAGDGVGFLMLPEPGTGVWVEFEGGDPSYPIWVGCFWGRGQIPDQTGATVKIVRTEACEVKLDDLAQEVTTTTDQGGKTSVTGSVELTAGMTGGKLTVSPASVTGEKGVKKVEITDVSVSVNSGALNVL